MSNSELVNNLIRQAREQQIEVDYIRAKIERGLKTDLVIEQHQRF